ncbi:MAG: hypothetical protein ABIQ84_06765 [Usitatibacter sp.]
MDFPDVPADPQELRRSRGPIALWMLMALIGFVLAGAAAAACSTTDTRDFAGRHGSVLATRAL